MTVEYISIAIYLIFLVGLGVWASRLNNSVRDFVRGGGKAAWWMVGTSMFVSGISAFTFTGNASAAFLSGPTFLIIYAAGCLGYLLCVIVAPWFRQTRADTWADVMRERFGVSVEQFSVSISLIMAPLSGAIQLYALAVFANVLMPEIPIHWLIVVLGGVAVAYSTTGGRWGVMATDFVQGIILFAVTLLVCHLSIKAVGGWSAFFSYFSDPRVAEDFKFVKEPGEFAGDRYTWKWIVVIFIMQIQGYINLGTAGRFLSVKDGPSARKAAIMAAVLTFIGAAVWFVPPMVARFVMQDAVLAMDIKEPATASYAVIAMKLLPNGLAGLLLAAMFAATMSSLDSSLNGTAGILIKNFLPFIRRLLRLPELSDVDGLRWCKLSTIFFGVAMVVIACGLSVQQEFELFDAFLLITAIIGLPLGLPVLVGLWVKRLHWASYYIIIACSSVPSAYFIFAERSGDTWHIQDRLPWIYLGGLVGMLVSLPLWRFASEAYKVGERGFFKKMHTPVDFEAEIGEANDSLQLGMVGFSSLLMGVMVACLLFVPNTLEQRLQILFIAVFMATIGAFFSWKSRESQKRFRQYQRASAQVNDAVTSASKL